MLVFHDQPIDDDAQVAFSRHFGPLEVTLSANPAAGTPFARQSNLDIKTGDVIPPEDRRMIYQQANMLWHSDSSFKRVPALCSLLSGRVVPPEGGATEFASTRAGYAALPEATRRRLEDLVVVHDFSWSRDQISPGFFTAEEKAPFPPYGTGSCAPIPSTAGAPSSSAPTPRRRELAVEEGRVLLKELPRPRRARSARPARAARGRPRGVGQPRRPPPRHPYDAIRYRRLMQRTTVSATRGRTSHETRRPQHDDQECDSRRSPRRRPTFKTRPSCAGKTRASSPASSR